MADEIRPNFSLSASKGYLTMNRRCARPITLTASSPAKASGVISVGFASHEAIPLGDVATNGVAWFENLDTTNYIELGVVVSATFYPFVRLNPGEGYPFRLAQGITPYAKANVAACKMDYDILDD